MLKVSALEWQCWCVVSPHGTLSRMTGVVLSRVAHKSSVSPGQPCCTLFHEYPCLSMWRVTAVQSGTSHNNSDTLTGECLRKLWLGLMEACFGETEGPKLRVGRLRVVLLWHEQCVSGATLSHAPTTSTSVNYSLTSCGDRISGGGVQYTTQLHKGVNNILRLFSQYLE